jgi:hypothetical protein
MNDDVISTNRLALQATIHCLTGCSIGEILGLVIASRSCLPGSSPGR